MNQRLSFDDALDAAITAIRAGRPLDDVLTEHRTYAATLEPLLATAVELRDARPTPPRSDRIIHDYDVLRAAVERARTARVERPANIVKLDPPGIRAPWWRQRLAYTLFLFVLAGGGATVAGSAGVHERVAEIVAPGFIGNSGERVEEAPGPAPVAPDGPGSGPRNRTLVRVEGHIRSLQGNGFVLQTLDGEWRVTIDADTQITGSPAEGAAAEVTGFDDGERRMRATAVAVTPPGPAADAPAVAPRGLDIPGASGRGGGSASGSSDQDSGADSTPPPQEPTPPADSRKGPKKTPPGYGP